MSEVDVKEKVLESLDLVLMLENICAAGPVVHASSDQVAWHGMARTLLTVRQNLLSLSRSMERTSANEGSENRRSSALAGRVQKAPTVSGEVRELSD